MADDHDKQNHFKKYDCVVCNSVATQTCEPLLPPPPSSTSILLKGSSWGLSRYGQWSKSGRHMPCLWCCWLQRTTSIFFFFFFCKSIVLPEMPSYWLVKQIDGRYNHPFDNLPTWGDLHQDGGDSWIRICQHDVGELHTGHPAFGLAGLGSSCCRCGQPNYSFLWPIQTFGQREMGQFPCTIPGLARFWYIGWRTQPVCQKPAGPTWKKLLA